VTGTSPWAFYVKKQKITHKWAQTQLKGNQIFDLATDPKIISMPLCTSLYNKMFV